jgi:hypothetical protein
MITHPYKPEEPIIGTVADVQPTGKGGQVVTIRTKTGELVNLEWANKKWYRSAS